jgi:hypothetical protein
MHLLRFTPNTSKSDIIACISIVDTRVTVKKTSVTSRIVFGAQRNKQYRPIMIIPILSSTSPCVHVEFDLFSDNLKSDYRLQLIIEPIQFTYDAVSNEKKQ